MNYKIVKFFEVPMGATFIIVGESSIKYKKISNNMLPLEKEVYLEYLEV